MIDYLYFIVGGYCQRGVAPLVFIPPFDTIIFFMQAPFFRFYFDDSSPLAAIDIRETNFNRAYDAMRSIIPGSYKFVRYNYFDNLIIPCHLTK